MLLLRFLLLTFVALATARSRRFSNNNRKRACTPQSRLQYSNSSSSSTTGSTTGSSGNPPGNSLTTSSSGGINDGGGYKVIGDVISSSFTYYGDGDTFKSGNCHVSSTACGWYSSKGHNAAASENLYGVIGAGGQGGSGCGKCFHCVMTSDASGAARSGNVTVKINNLCPVAGNELCAQDSLSATNSLGTHVNIDLCKDDGASAALFGTNPGVGIGSIVEVDCGNGFGQNV